MSSGVAGGLRVFNDSSPAGGESSWWNWSVWVDGPSRTLDKVESVTYTLHPTFKDPVHTVRERSDSFRLRASGWGEFMIEVEVRMKDGAIHTMEHWLSLGAGETEEESVGTDESIDEDLDEDPDGDRGESSPATGTAGLGDIDKKKSSPGPPKGKASKPSFLERSLMAAAESRVEVRKLFHRTGISKALPGLNRVKVFLSSPILYKDIAREIEQGLSSRGVEFVTAESGMPPGVPVSWWIRKVIASCDGVVAILGGYLDTTIILEPMFAAAGEHPVLLVVPRSTLPCEIPEGLQKVTRLEFDPEVADRGALVEGVFRFVESELRGVPG